MKPELSNTTIEQLREVSDLPENFDNLNKSKQKEIVINTLISVYKEALDTIEYERKTRKAVKVLTADLKKTDLAQKLSAIKKEQKRYQIQSEKLMDRYLGMRQLAAALGISDKCVRVKQIEG